MKNDSNLDRREFLRRAAVLGAGTAVTACGGGGNGTPDGGEDEVDLDAIEEPADFDYPLVLPLPFAHGLASGDPLADRVIIWTRITAPNFQGSEIPVDWEVSATPDFAAVLWHGRQITTAGRDWTVKVDVVGLSAATTYYYRFRAFGVRSIVGRTRTAPASMVEEVRFAVVACSSYWSSHWSGYAHLADRNDLDLILHCGDYIYDFVDEDEEVRARLDVHDTAYVDYRDWLDLDELRRRYALYRSDPNLLRAHQQHPWMIVWDNHDISVGFGNELPTDLDADRSTTTLEDTVRAFHEWTPTRPVLADGSGTFMFVDDGRYPEPPDARLIYRKLAYGPLVDFLGVDTQLRLPGYGLEVDAGHLPEGAPSLLGRRQYEWLLRELVESQAQGTVWRVINNQTWISPWGIPDVIPGVPTGVELAGRWGDYAVERAQLFGQLRGDNDMALRVHNNIVVSGDMHGNFASDLVDDNSLLSPDYFSGLPLPNPRTGSTAENVLAGFQRAGTGNLGPLNSRAASVGVEFAPSSMGRGGADEIVANAAPGTPFAAQVAASRAIELVSLSGNKNIQFMEWVDHGYGLVSLTAERAIFEFWWQDKLTPGSSDVLGMQMVSFAQDDSSQIPGRFQDQIDAVGLHGMAVEATQGSRRAEPAPAPPVLMPR